MFFILLTKNMYPFPTSSSPTNFKKMEYTVDPNFHLRWSPTPSGTAKTLSITYSLSNKVTSFFLNCWKGNKKLIFPFLPLLVYPSDLHYVGRLSIMAIVFATVFKKSVEKFHINYEQCWLDTQVIGFHPKDSKDFHASFGIHKHFYF